MNERRPLLGVIGTAGRDASIEMSWKTWDWMVNDFKDRLKGTEHLVSGGAAWADHLAVVAFNLGWVSELTLHLPAPFSGFYYLGNRRSSGDVANHYHRLFRDITGENSLHGIATALKKGAHKTEQKLDLGLPALFARNSLIAAGLDGLIAYTFKSPTAGGTGDTWKKAGERIPKTSVIIPLNFP